MLNMNNEFGITFELKKRTGPFFFFVEMLMGC